MEQSPVENTPVVLLITCRPASSNWVAVVSLGFFSLMSLLIPFTDKGTAGRAPDLKADWAMAAFFCPCFLIPAMLWAIWTVRACIIADDNGLRWRRVNLWHSAHWAEVTDYYERLPQKRSSPVSAIIETATGRLKFDACWRNSEALRFALMNCAVKARVNEWGILGTRPEDGWPRVFDYEPHKTRRSLSFLAFLILGALVVPLWKMPSRLLRDYGTEAFHWDLAGLGLWLVFMGSYFGLIYYGTIRQYRGALKRANQRFVADTSSLTLEDGNRTLRLNWKDVTDYFIAGTGHVSDLSRYAVIGKEMGVEFLPTLRDARILAAMVSRYAVCAKPKQWRRQECDVLGGSASRWSGGCEGVGERIFGYRTRTHRALLWLLGFMALLYPLSVLERRAFGLPIKDDTTFVAFLMSALWVSLVWCLWRYHTARIQIDARGITQTALVGKRFLAWADVQDYFLSGDGETYLFGNVVESNGSRIRFWTSIADLEKLQEEIARRATHCRGQSWEKKERQRALVKR